MTWAGKFLARKTPSHWGKSRNSADSFVIPGKTSTGDVLLSMGMSPIPSSAGRNHSGLWHRRRETEKLANARLMRTCVLSASNNLEEMVDSRVCNNSKACAYCECKDSETSTVPLTRSQSNTEVSLTQCCLEKTDRAGEEAKGSFITVKKDTAPTEEDLMTEFEDRLFKVRRHLFNFRWEDLTNDCLIHIDFSENYTCKYASKIQSVHFGNFGLHNQGMLHTGVLYVAEEPPHLLLHHLTKQKIRSSSHLGSPWPHPQYGERPVPCSATHSLL